MMKKVLIAIVYLFALILLGVSVGFIIRNPSDNLFLKNNEEVAPEIKENLMVIKSPAFENNNSIPSRYTCDGLNTSPPLYFSEIPKKAKSLVLIVDDPDAPGGTFTHWIVWNIDPQNNEIKEGEIPQGGIQGLNDFGKSGWSGPCPPSGKHKYIFKLFALDTVLNLPEDTKRDQIDLILQNHIINLSELIGTYQRM